MIKKLYNFFKKWDYKIKFLMVGGLNTVVGLGSYWLVLLICGVNLTKNNPNLVWPIVVATLVSQVLGLLNSYFWNKHFTFESKKKSKMEVFKFILVYLVAFAVDYVLKLVLRKSTPLNELLIALITTITTMIISFVGQKVFVFKFKKQKISNINASINVEDKEKL